MKMTELFAVPDTFATGVGRVDVLAGGFARFVWYVERRHDDGATENVIVASIIMAIDGIAPMREIEDAAINAYNRPTRLTAGVH